jgi:uncharacterized protein (DUF362 family)
MSPLSPALVALARTPSRYGLVNEPAPAPELPEGMVETVAAAAVRQLLLNWNLDRLHQGTASWNPLGDFIPPGAKVVLKPNWVLHYNQSGQGLDCLVTHPDTLEAVLRYVALTNPAKVTVGDAPIQGCDFEQLSRSCALDEMLARTRNRGLAVHIVDFRRTILESAAGRQRHRDVRPIDQYVLFDLAGDSLLEPLGGDAERFRVTMYDPRMLSRTHAPGKHQYLIAREVIDADVVINMPKLKCHKKAGITAALKNMVGINGNKEYLPHHRKGGDRSGGDCYPGSSWLKARAEDMLDMANRNDPGPLHYTFRRASALLTSCAGALGDNADLEGSWHGNDTVWRTCLDLQRILHYGDLHGRLQNTHQRRVITITDGIIAGEGEGPLANTPAEAGLMTAGRNTAAIDWCHARLMGIDPTKIALVQHAFDPFRYPLTVDFQPSDVQVVDENGVTPADSLRPLLGRAFVMPSGWRGHCELKREELEPACQ